MKPVPTKQKLVAFKVTLEQYKAIEQRAERRGVRVSTWMRSILVQAASQVSEDGYIRKLREPDGALT
jgi:uncharacterized protein (DUF1778 family)